MTHPGTSLPRWKDFLAGERKKPYLRNVLEADGRDREAGKTIYPAACDIFAAFRHTELGEVKAVILGQDPYHGPGQAHGLCFSVPRGVPVPRSLANIYKELAMDLPGFRPPSHGCLESWAGRGVLLLNAVLTVEAGKPGSHAGRGWEAFTDRALAAVNECLEGAVFLLWGAAARAKGALVDRKRHLVLEAAHPSPFSAARGFLGCRHFSKANAYLEARGKAPVDWRL